MTTTTKRWCVAALALLMAIMACACSTAEPPAPAPAPATAAPAATAQPPAATAAAPAAAAPVTIHIMNRVNAEVNVNVAENAVLQEIEKRTNTKLNYEAPPIKNYVDRMNIVMASGDLPDVLYTWGIDANYEKWAAEGLFIALDEYLPKYQNVQNNVSAEQWKMTLVPATGKIHAIPRPHLIVRYGMIMRKDWLNKLGLQMPTNADNFKQTMIDMTTKDPDGNGQNDTFGVSLDTNYFMPFLMHAFDLPDHNGIPDKDGTYKLRENMSGYMPYLDYVRELYSLKVLDQEFFLNKVYGNYDKYNMGLIACVSGHESNIYRALQPTGPEKQDFAPPFAGSDGKSYSYHPPTAWGAWCVTNKAKDVDAVMKFMDWAFSDEGVKLVGLGIEGRHYQSYDEANRVIVRTADQAAQWTKELSPYMNFSNTYKGLFLFAEGVDNADLGAMYAAQMDNYGKTCTMIDLPYIKITALAKYSAENPDLDKKRDEQIVKYITGEMDKTAFETFLNTEYRPKIEEMQKEYQDIMAKSQ